MGNRCNIMHQLTNVQRQHAPTAARADQQAGSMTHTGSTRYSYFPNCRGVTIARAVGYGPYGTHGIDVWPCAGSARSKSAKSALAAANVPAGRAGGEYRDRSTESRTVPSFGLGIVT
jgi:hypothetical protein